MIICRNKFACVEKCFLYFQELSWLTNILIVSCNTGPVLETSLSGIVTDIDPDHRVNAVERENAENFLQNRRHRRDLLLVDAVQRSFWDWTMRRNPQKGQRDDHHIWKFLFLVTQVDALFFPNRYVVLENRHTDLEDHIVGSEMHNKEILITAAVR